ncbi:hypothetical protein TWF481_010258 [Arthrobotrys musiformis]|uniref:Uncharacterized protein n=1 Tax=Arthrobotrys musiformis TaxID=47236 RepID=A0AAV9W699_9PEZI
MSRKIHELGEALREKSRREIQIQEKYNRLEHESLVSQVQNNRASNHTLGSYRDGLSGTAGFGGPNSTVNHQGDQGRVIGASRSPFFERERLTVPSGRRSIDRGEGSISDGNSESGRRVGTSASRSRIPMNGRSGGEYGGWNSGTPRGSIAL